jgi:hypothetical protein
VTLQAFEAQSHAQHVYDANAPETKEAFEEIARFFYRHLGNKRPIAATMTLRVYDV